MKAILQSHWAAFLFFVPFLVMLTIHHCLGLSDALMVRAPPGEREAYDYNLLMVAVFYFGIYAFVGHTIALAPKGRAWVAVKVLALGIYCITVLAFAAAMTS
jgi:hypothetical protein